MSPLLLWLKPFPCPPNRSVVRITPRTRGAESSALITKWMTLTLRLIIRSQATRTSSHQAEICLTCSSLLWQLQQTVKSPQHKLSISHSEQLQITKRQTPLKSIVFYSIILKILHVALCKINLQQNKQRNTRQTSGNIAEGGQYKTQNQ